MKPNPHALTDDEIRTRFFELRGYIGRCLDLDYPLNDEHHAHQLRQMLMLTKGDHSCSD